MIASDTLSKLFVLAGRVDELVKARGKITLSDAFVNPEIAAARDALLELFKTDVQGMIDAAKAMGDAWEEIHAQEPTPENLEKLRLLGPAHRTLSLIAEGKAAEPWRLFAYTMTLLWPFLEQLARAGVLVVSAAI